MEQLEYQGHQINYEIQRADISNIYIKIKDGTVMVRVPDRMPKEQIKEIVERKANWIQKNQEKSEKKVQKEELYTQEEFVELVHQQVLELIRLTNLHPKKVRIKELKYAWGSCSIQKHIALNSNLIKYSKEAIRYVILHELCHIKHMNHSKDFWGLVEVYMPNHKEVQKEFK